MATDVDVQYFSHLNGLVLGNNWGDLIRLLDKALVTGIDFTQITAASIDAQGDVHITLFAAHNAMLFQVVELSGFTPNSLNQKYRIKGVPSTTQLILKPALDIAERSITTLGVGKLASLGYDIIFRDTNDVKRVYRAKNPTALHPFIRVDESLTSPDGSSGIYNSAYAKFAMIGLLEHMSHIDDFERPDVLQLPLDPSDSKKNWKITGTGTGVIRGWSRWYWARSAQINEPSVDSTATYAFNRQFTLCGDKDAFYLLKNDYHYPGYPGNRKYLSGCGVFNQSTETDNQWFLMSYLTSKTAGQSVYQYQETGGAPLVYGIDASKFISTKDSNELQAHVVCSPILPDYSSGASNVYSGNVVAPLEIPFFDVDRKLRGSLKHIMYSGKNHSAIDTEALISSNSMYIYDNISANPSGLDGCLIFYLGGLE